VVKSNNQCAYCLVGWVIEGSHDSFDWTKLDKQNTPNPSGNSIIRYFPINDSSNLPFSAISDFAKLPRIAVGVTIWLYLVLKCLDVSRLLEGAIQDARLSKSSLLHIFRRASTFNCGIGIDSRRQTTYLCQILICDGMWRIAFDSFPGDLAISRWM
jgi:hypothetical protein